MGSTVSNTVEDVPRDLVIRVDRRRRPPTAGSVYHRNDWQKLRRLEKFTNIAPSTPILPMLPIQQMQLSRCLALLIN